MTTVNYTSTFPQALALRECWTLSSTNKIPLDATLLTKTYGMYHYNPTKRPKLYTREQMQPLLEKYPECQLCCKMTKESQFLAVDIEPEGMVKTNPYLTLPFIYLEFSTNNGLHGLIPFTKASELSKGIFKDETHHTEFFAFDHFISWTGRTAVLKTLTENKKIAQSEDIQEKLLKLLNYLGGPLETDHHYFNQQSITHYDLTPSDQQLALYIQTQLKSFNGYPLGCDQSRIDAKYMAHVIGKCFVIDPTLKNLQNYRTRLLPIACYLIDQQLPYRKKHRVKANFTHYGYTTNRMRSIESIARFLIQKEQRNTCQA